MYPPNEKAATHGANQRAADSKKQHRNNATNGRQVQGGFCRAKLPSPAMVLQRLMIPVLGINHAGFFILRCPFHKNGQEQHPSLNFHATSGHYRCHACGACGGDVLAFYMTVTGKDFRDAAHDLGALGNV